MTEATKTKKTTRKVAPSGLYAVFTTGGKQYRVQAGDKVKIEILPGEHTEGETLSFDQVLMVDNGGTEVTLGKPYISGAAVTAKIAKIGRYKTVDVIKYQPKSRYFKKRGHRQPYFEIEVTSVK